MPNWTQKNDFCSGSLHFLIPGIFSFGFSGNISVGLSWPSVLTWTMTLLMPIHLCIDGRGYRSYDSGYDDEDSCVP